MSPICILLKDVFAGGNRKDAADNIHWSHLWSFFSAAQRNLPIIGETEINMKRKSEPRTKPERERGWAENIDCAFGLSKVNTFPFYNLSIRNYFLYGIESLN